MLFELNKYDERLHRIEPTVPSSEYEPVSDIQKRSFLYWAEHCIECAAPLCYQTCDLYEPRADSRCRRFTFGAFKNKNFPARDGYGVEISFKKWAKMEAYGNLRLGSLVAVALSERLVEYIAPAVDVVGRSIAALTKKPRWQTLTHVVLEELARRMHPIGPNQELPDAFLLEVYNPTAEVIRMQLSFSALPSGGTSQDGPLVKVSQSFRETVACPPGYKCHEVDAALLRHVIEPGAFLVSLAPEADQDARLVFLSADFVKFASRRADAVAGKIKCVVFDLDNTLWKGILAEGDHVSVEPETIDLLKHLDERGILMSIASKNDREIAWGKIQELGLAEYFLYPQINWNPKSQAIRAIAERLNIGVDSLAFVDDNPFELGEVSRACPAVLCVDAGKSHSLFYNPRFQGSRTAEAPRRRQLYREAEARETAQESFGEDYLGFLASCEIQVEVSRFVAEDSERVAELVQRTNQLNFSGHKHTRAELERIFAEPRLEKLVLKSRDRYGSYGTIGFCIVERSGEVVLVHDLMLSCRVQGKQLERALFYHLAAHHWTEVPSTLWINFRNTPRNTPAQKVLESLDFRACDLQSGQFSHGMTLTSLHALRCDIIGLQCTCHFARSEPTPDASRVSAA